MKPDGYAPDLCLFDPEINIEDQATVGIKYDNGVGVSYSLNAHSSIAGHNMYMDDLFGGGRKENKHLATLMDGIQAVLIGAAANISIRTGKEVDVQNLIA